MSAIYAMTWVIAIRDMVTLSADVLSARHEVDMGSV